MTPNTAASTEMTASEAELEAAVQIIQRAGDFTASLFGSHDLDLEHKSDGTPVTRADRGAERLVRDQLAELFPDDGVIGEEFPNTSGTSGRCWVVDPIDGTKAFTRSVPTFSNLLHLAGPDGGLLSVVNMPALGETVWAGAGLGCFWNGVPCKVSATERIATMCLTSSGYDYWSTDMLAALHRTGCEVQAWGDGYGYALVASGRVDAMVDPEVAFWDVAPMSLLLSEAGGRFSALNGVDAASEGSGVGTNGIIHDDLLALLGPFQTTTH